MTDDPYLLPAPRMSPLDEPPDPRSALDTLATVLTLILVVGILYFARQILVPIAIAVLLSFALSPLVKALRKLGLGKRLAVGIVVLATFLFAVGLGAILTNQVVDLAAEAPRLQSTVAGKTEAVRTFIAHNPMLGKLNTILADLQAPAPSQTAKRPPPEPGPAKSKPAPVPPKPSEPGAPAADGGTGAPLRVQVISPAPGALTLLQGFIGMAASPLATAAFVAIFIVFILMQREDLRNRFIRLAGSSDLQRTTLAMNDAASRLSRYFLVQALLNIGFGAAVAAALTIIGVPSPLLWGIVAAFMRFIPYIGSIVAAAFPIVFAVAAEPGWALAIETAVFFVVLEALVGQVVEPLVYGHHTGISPIAVVASATFWTWLWGPVGLVLSTPMTVCLVVIGRHVNRLAFLDVLLGDAPALSQVEIFYQRMLAGDPSEILDHAVGFMAAHSLLAYSDEIAMRALLMAQDDVRRGVLDAKRQLRIRDTMRDLAPDLVDIGEAAPAKAPPPSPDEADGDELGQSEIGPDLDRAEIDAAWREPDAVLCFAGRTPLDEAAAHLLADLLRERGIGAQVEPADSLARTDAAYLETREPRLVVLSFLDADLGSAQARIAVRRIRRKMPRAPLLAAFWMAEPDIARLETLSNELTCDLCAASLGEAVRLCLERAAHGGLVDAAERADTHGIARSGG